MNQPNDISITEKINKLTIDLLSYIKENLLDIFEGFNLNHLDNIILANYAKIFIKEGESVADEFLYKMERSFHIYNINKESKKIESINNEIKNNIDKLFINIDSINGRVAIKTNKNKIHEIIMNNYSLVSIIEIEAEKIFIHINPQSESYSMINLKEGIEYYASKKQLLNAVQEKINSNKDVYIRLFNKNEFNFNYYINTWWNVSYKDVMDDIVKEIKAKKQIYINENISVELLEYYNYKSVYLLIDKESNSEKIIHIYTEDIEESLAILRANYQNIEEGNHHAMYKLGNQWYSLKEKIDISIDSFSQQKNLFKLLKDVIYNVNLITHAETSMASYQAKTPQGLCYGINLKYLIEIRNNGLEGGVKYLSWLKGIVDMYTLDSSVYNRKFDNLIYSSFFEYNNYILVKEIKSIIFAHKFQHKFRYYEDDNVQGKYFFFNDDIKQFMEYEDYLYQQGLKITESKKIEINDNNIASLCNSIVNSNKNLYLNIVVHEHVISIGYKRYASNIYKITLFNSNDAVVEFDNIDEFKKILVSEIKYYGGIKDNNKRYLFIDEYEETEGNSYKSYLDKNEKNKGIANTLKKLGFELPFSDKINGKIVDYDLKNNLTIELIKNNKIIEVIVKNTDVIEGVYLVKNNLERIIENNLVSKVIVNKKNSKINITPIEFNTVYKKELTVGKVNFDGVYYKNLLEINASLLNGEKAKKLSYIVSLIDKLNSHIYFDKLNSAFMLINCISEFEKESIIPALRVIIKRIKERIENKLFYSDLIFSKEKLLAVAEKNTSAAAKIYQFMVNEINNENRGISEFIYNNLIESSYLLLDKRENQGIVGYDFTIIFKEVDINLKKLIDSINVGDLKNTLYLEDVNTLHLKDHYQKINQYRNDENVNKLLNLIEKEIKLRINEPDNSYRYLYLELFSNQQYFNKMIMHEINQLEAFYYNNTKQNHYYHYSQFYIPENDPKKLIEKTFNTFKSHMDNSYIIFENSNDNLIYLFRDNNIFSSSDLDGIIIDSLDEIYQDDVRNYIFNNIESEYLSSILNSNNKIKLLLDFCKKNKIRVICSGENESKLMQDPFIKQKNKIDDFYDLIIRNQYKGEKILVLISKDKISTQKHGPFIIEGIPQRLNSPVYHLNQNKLTLLNKINVYKANPYKNKEKLFKTPSPMNTHLPIVNQIKEPSIKNPQSNIVSIEENIFITKKREIDDGGVKGIYISQEQENSAYNKVVLMTSEQKDINNRTQRYINEYYKLGYDLFIVDTKLDKDAGEKGFYYLKDKYGVNEKDILLHSINKNEINMLELNNKLSSYGYFTEGIVLNLSTTEQLSSLIKYLSGNNLRYKMPIYIAYEYPYLDESNDLVYKVLKTAEHDVRKFSFSYRDEYEAFDKTKINDTPLPNQFAAVSTNNLHIDPFQFSDPVLVGMPESEQQVFSNIAEKEGVIIGVRPIDLSSTALIASKEYSSKGLLIKAKSADWGPMAGFIPVNQALAKASARNAAQKYNQYVAEALSENNAVQSELILSQKRVDELVEHKLITKYNAIIETDFILVNSQVDNVVYPFFLKKTLINGNEHYQVYLYQDAKLVPLKVIADPISYKPMIADYDLFTIMYSYKDHGSETTIKQPIPWEEWKTQVEYEKLSSTYQEFYNDKQLYERYEGRQLGLISNKVKKIKNELNKALGRSKGMEIIHHGADDANPHAVIADNFPATFFLPEKIFRKKLNKEGNTLKDFFYINDSGTLVIKTVQEFSIFQQLMINLGFLSPLNERWNDGLVNDYFKYNKKTSDFYIDNKEKVKLNLLPESNEYKKQLGKLENKLKIGFDLDLGSNYKNKPINHNIEIDSELFNLSSSTKKENNIESVINHRESERKVSNITIEEMKWFESVGISLLNEMINNENFPLFRNEVKKLNKIIKEITLAPEIENTVYKSIKIDDLNEYEKKINKGILFATEELMIATTDSSDIKFKNNNIYIAIKGKHYARSLGDLYNRDTNDVIIMPATHLRVIEKVRKKNKLYLVLEATNQLFKNESVTDLYDGKLNGFVIDGSRSTINEKIEKKVVNKQIINEISKIQETYIAENTINKIYDKILERKLSIEYACHKYFNELTSFFNTNTVEKIAEKLNYSIFDPIINKRMNQYLSGTIEFTDWHEIENINKQKLNLNEKINLIKDIIHAVHDDPYVVNKLSPISESLIKAFFNRDLNQNIGHILLNTISTTDKYKKVLLDLDLILFLNQNNLLFDKLSIEEVVKKTNTIKTRINKSRESLFLLKNTLSSNSSNKLKFQLTPIFSPFSELNNKLSDKIILINAILNKKYSPQETLDTLLLSNKYLDQSVTGEITENEQKFIDSFNKVINQVSRTDFIDNFFTFSQYGLFVENISSLEAGNYLIDIDATNQKFSISIEQSNNGDLSYHLFSEQFGNIKVTGKDKIAIINSLSSFLNASLEQKKVQNKRQISNNEIQCSIYQHKQLMPIQYNVFKEVFNNGIIANNEDIKKNSVKINETFVNKVLLGKLGAKVNGEKIESIDVTSIENWLSKLTFNAKSFNDYFFTISGNDQDKKVINLILNLFKNKENKVNNIIDINTNRADYLSATHRLKQIIELGNKEYSLKEWNKLRYPLLTIPRYMKVISKIGYGNIAYSIWQSINSTFTLAEQLNNNQLTAKEHREIVTNLSIMWSEMVYNGISEVIEIALAKGLLRYRNNPLEYASKISTRVAIGLNLLSIGFDIYNAYDNFRHLDTEYDEKRRIDYIVNGSFAIVSGLMTLGISIAMLAGSTIAGPIGIVAGTIIALASSIYNAARIIEQAKEKIRFTPLEEINNGFYAFIMGDLLPSKKNELVKLEAESQLNEITEKNVRQYFDDLLKKNDHSYYFYTNEKYIYEEHYYYQVLPTFMGKELDIITNPAGVFISQRMATKLDKKTAEIIASFSSSLRAEITEYKYYIPKEAIPTDEVLIFDIDFNINHLNKYSIDIISDDDTPYHDEIVDNNFINNLNNTKDNVIKSFGRYYLNKNFFKINNNRGYLITDLSGKEEFYFNTNNGNDIIAAPQLVKNIFDIHNGTKRLSGGDKDDIFNLFTSKSPKYASRFYGREGNDTLRLIRTTKEYKGHYVNLTENFVKFKGSENETNSQNFHSKLFLYIHHGRIYSKKIQDSMPQIILQDDQVIAYLDNFENVIGSEIGSDTIIGNEKANYLDGVDGVDFLYGLAGNDILALVEGFAEGGEGNDTYIIHKANFGDKYNKITKVIINEVSDKESSVIKINYTFDKIYKIIRKDKNIIIDFKIKNESVTEGFDYHSITLNNFFQNKTNYTLSHRYSIMTSDGFILTANDLDNKNTFFNFTYLGDYNYEKNELLEFGINKLKNNLTLKYTNDVLKNIPLLKELAYTGVCEGNDIRFNITGDQNDNKYFGLTEGSSISLTSGHDNYQLKEFSNKEKVNSIKFSSIIHPEELIGNSSTNLFLSNVSGFNLMYNNNILSHRYNKNAYLRLVFDELALLTISSSAFSLRVIDKDNIVFKLEKNNDGVFQLVVISDLNITISESDDNLMIPPSLMLNKEILSLYGIDPLDPKISPLTQSLQNKKIHYLDWLPIISLLDGNDILVNNNSVCSVIDGGEGNDDIVVNDGHHILIAGKGNDKLTSGRGNDLLISEFGHDYLNGGTGNNTYVIQRRLGHVTVYDEGENSQIIVTGLFDGESLLAKEFDNGTQYRTQDNQFILTLKTKKDPARPSIKVIEKKTKLTTDKLANVIHRMAQFNELQLSSMQGSEYIPSFDWSPQDIVIRQL